MGGHSYKYPSCTKPWTLVAICWTFMIHNKKKIFIFLLSVPLFFLCGLAKGQNMYDTSKVIVFDYPAPGAFLFDSAYRSTVLTKTDFLNIEKLLTLCITKYNRRQKSWKRIDLRGYVRQIVPVINSKGEKIVWINCLCLYGGENKEWRNGIITADDGGKCYFNLKINLTNKLYFDLMVNGQA